MVCLCGPLVPLKAPQRCYMTREPGRDMFEHVPRPWPTGSPTSIFYSVDWFLFLKFEKKGGTKKQANKKQLMRWQIISEKGREETVHTVYLNVLYQRYQCQSTVRGYTRQDTDVTCLGCCVTLVQCRTIFFSSLNQRHH